MKKSLSRDERIDLEARSIAQDLIQKKLEEKHLPLPKDSALAVHIDKLLALKPEIISLAIERVDAKQDAYAEGLNAIGLSVRGNKALDLTDI